MEQQQKLPSSSGTTTSTDPTTKRIQKLPPGPPSHILADGHFVYLPPPSDAQKASYFSRTVAKHNLIQAEQSNTTTNNDKKDNKNKDQKEQQEVDPLKQQQDDNNSNNDDGGAMRIHPLLIASARLQANGISELSKMINLGTLVTQDEYFAVNTIVKSQETSDGTTTADTTTSTTKDAETESKTKTTTSTDSNTTDAESKGTNNTNKSNEGSSTKKQTQQELQLTKLQSQQQEEAKLESNLRSTYILQQKQSQFTSASQTLSRFHKRCEVVTVAQRRIDGRLLGLRKRWALAAPEYGWRVGGEVRSKEIVAVDVEIYHRDRKSATSSSGSDDGGSNSGNNTGKGVLGRIARMVPRYAVIELADDYDIKQDLNRRRKRLKSTSTSSNSDASTIPTNSTDVTGDTATDATDTKEEKDDVIMIDVNDESSKKTTTTGTENNESTTEKNEKMSTSSSSPSSEDDTENGIFTRAEPFAVADPTLGTIDKDFDPQKVPTLTLLFQIEKASTGFVQSVSLSSSASTCSSNPIKSSGTTNTNIDEKKEQRRKRKANDEQTIEIQQHSLFCAKLFDSIRQEIILGRGMGGGRSAAAGSSKTQSNGNGNTSRGRGTASAAQKINRQTLHPKVWLSSEMEESFLPPPSLLVGSGEENNTDENSGFQSSPLCVIHCHEGEIKVQLDSEYALTVQLVEAKNGHYSNNGIDKKKNDDNVSSGSQSPEQLHALCRMILLHSQFVYHDFNSKQQQIQSKEESKNDNNGNRGNGQNYSFASTKKKVVEVPHILKSCVNLGAKTLLEHKVRKVLKRIKQWLREHNHESEMVVEWLPLSLFDSHSQFSLSIGSSFCVDVSIDGYDMSVRGFGDEGIFRSVNFSTSEEFELFLKMEIQSRLLSPTTSEQIIST